MQELILSNSSKDKEAQNKLNSLKNVFSCLLELVEHVPITISEKGITTMKMDSLQVCFFELFFKPDMFSQFRCDQQTMIGVPLQMFHRVIKNMDISSDDSYFAISCADDHPESIKIENKCSSSLSSFELQLVSISESGYDVPSIDFTSTVILSIEVVKRITRNAICFNEYITFIVNKDQIEIVQKTDTMESNTVLTNDNDSVIIYSTKSVETKLNRKYFENVVKIAGASDKIEISFGDSDSPVLFSVDLNKFGIFKIYVAPQHS